MASSAHHQHLSGDQRHLLSPATVESTRCTQQKTARRFNHFMAEGRSAFLLASTASGFEERPQCGAGLRRDRSLSLGVSSRRNVRMPGKVGNYDPLHRMDAMRLNLSASVGQTACDSCYCSSTRMVFLRRNLQFWLPLQGSPANSPSNRGWLHS